MFLALTSNADIPFTSNIIVFKETISAVEKIKQGRKFFNPQHDSVTVEVQIEALLWSDIKKVLSSMARRLRSAARRCRKVHWTEYLINRADKFPQ